jgi:hypothetical protein
MFAARCRLNVVPGTCKRTDSDLGCIAVAVATYYINNNENGSNRKPFFLTSSITDITTWDRDLQPIFNYQIHI